MFEGARSTALLVSRRGARPRLAPDSGIRVQDGQRRAPDQGGAHIATASGP
jgi:hypothetical protein